MRRAVVKQVAIGGTLLACLLGHASVASAKPTPQQKKAATEGFRQCREQEEYGDATSCWRAWLEKHRETGGEAEVMVAEERAASKGPHKSKKSKKKPAAKQEPHKQEPQAAEPVEQEEQEEQEEGEEEAGDEETTGAIEVTLTETPQKPPEPPRLANETLQLSGSPNTYIISPGRDEGVAVGSSYAVRDASGNRTAYLKVMTTGPGGASGATQPTELSLRAGSVEEGARPEPMTMLGLSVMLHGAAQFAIMNSDTTWYEREVAEGGFLEYMIPNVYAGGGLTVGYDVSGAIHWYETHLRLRTEFLAGAAGATGTKATVIPIELLVEKGFYVGRGLMLYGALGPNATLALVDVLPPDDPIPDKPVSVQHLQAVRFGGALNAGLEFLFSPNLAMRVEGNARINIPKTGYSTTDGGPIYWDFHKRSDSYSMVGGRLGMMAKF